MKSTLYKLTSTSLFTVVIIDRSIKDVKKSSLEDKRPGLQDLTKPESFLGKVTRLFQEYFSAEHSDVPLVPWLCSWCGA